MEKRNSEAFIEQALIKVYSRGERTIQSVAEELNVNCHTVKNWMKRKRASTVGLLATKERRPQDWTTEQQLVALHETHSLTGEAMHTWCRENGLFTRHLSSWKTVCYEDTKVASGTRAIRVLKDEHEQLKRELIRKEHALAETAALLTLQKQFRVLWKDEVK